MKRNERGITLIALVVTIVVLLILAGVSISMLVGENGIITRAKESSKKTEVSNEQEQVEISYTAVKTGKWGEEITPEDIQKELEKLVGKNKTETTENGNGTINVEFLDTKNNYNINEEGKVTQVDKDAISYEMLYEYEDVEGGVSITGLTDNYLRISKYAEKLNEKAPDIPIELWKKVLLLGQITTEEELLEELNKLGISVEEFATKFEAASEGIDINAIRDEVEPKYKELLKEVGMIPKKIDGKKVVEIGIDAFKTIENFGDIELTKVVIPNTVRKIGQRAFNDCKIKEVSIPDSVIEIGLNAFEGNLLTNLTIPSSVEIIGSGAFGFNQLTKVVFEGVPTTVTFSGVEDFPGVFCNNNTLIENSIKVPAGSLEYFKSKISDWWWAVPENCFYE